MSYVLQDRLEEDLGEKIMATVLENYQHDYLIKESVDKVQIEVQRSPDLENLNDYFNFLTSTIAAVYGATRTGPAAGGAQRRED